MAKTPTGTNGEKWGDLQYNKSVTAGRLSLTLMFMTMLAWNSLSLRRDAEKGARAGAGSLSVSSPPFSPVASF